MLIGFGALFLAGNLWPELSRVELFAKYWPFLLIGWGVLRLLEIGFWAATSKPLPAAGISGGEWFLVILLCLIGAGAFWTRNRNWWPPPWRIGVRGIEVFGESYDFPIQEQTRPAKVSRVILENMRGNTRVSGADTQEVKVSGRKTVRAFRQSDAEEADRESPVQIVTESDQIVVRAGRERADGRRRISTDLEITVPRGAGIEGRGRYGDFDVTDINGTVQITSDNAGVRLHNIGGEVRIDLRRSDTVRAVNVKGPVDLRGRGRDVELENIEGQVTIQGSYSGDLLFRNLAKPLRFESSSTNLHIEKLPGRMSMDLGDITATNLVGPIRLTTKSRDVQLEEFTQSLEISVERGDIGLRPKHLPLAQMDARSGAGDLALTVPGSGKFELTARTSRGEAHNEFGPPIRVETNGHGASLKGAAGQGPSITLSTARGSITVRKE